MSLIARTYEKQALAIHYVVRGGLPFVDRAAALRVVVAAQDEIVRLRDQLAGAVEACLAQWVIAHDIKCGCSNPDTAGCDWPVPIPHTQDALDAALRGQ